MFAIELFLVCRPYSSRHHRLPIKTHLFQGRLVSRTRVLFRSKLIGQQLPELQCPELVFNYLSWHKNVPLVTRQFFTQRRDHFFYVSLIKFSRCQLCGAFQCQVVTVKDKPTVTEIALFSCDRKSVRDKRDKSTWKQWVLHHILQFMPLFCLVNCHLR